MRSAARLNRRPFAALTLFLGAAAAMILPVPSGAFAAGLVAVVLAVIVVSTIASARLVPVGAQIGVQTRAVLQRRVPRAAQSDPDAPGHARPRAPGILLPAL